MAQEPGMTDAEQRFNELSELLAIRVAVAVPDWVRRCVERGLFNAWERARGHWLLTDEDVRAVLRKGEAAGWAAAQDAGSRLWALRSADLADHYTTPLIVVQQTICYPAGVLRQAGVPPARRDRPAMKLFPQDVYDLVPRSLAVLHPQLPALNNAWEQAKVMVLQHRQRAYG